MERKALLILSALIVCASMLALGCTGQNNTGATATPTPDAIAPGQANDTVDSPPLPPSDTNGTFNGMPPMPGNNSSFNPMIPAAPGNNSTFSTMPAGMANNGSNVIADNGMQAPVVVTGT